MYIFNNHFYNKIFGELLCSLSSNPIAKSLSHTAVGVDYEHEYALITNLCSGFWYLSEVSIKTIEGAKERYKQFNKSLLELSHLSDEKIRAVSEQIDFNAESLKQQWISNLLSKGTEITE